MSHQIVSGRLAGVCVARRALIAATLAGAFAQPALANTAQDAANTAEASDQFSGEGIIVTGTRATGRTARESAAPIDVVSAADLNATGKANVLEALQNILPAFNVPASIQPDLGSIVRGGQLRNLDPGYTLVLINGRRRHTTSVTQDGGFAGSVWVDLGLIPSSAIERIEVLRDGASALYGSDAIAGVINIILNNKPGGSLSAEYGQSYEGDGAVQKYRGHYGFALGDDGFLNLSAEHTRQDLAIRSSPLKDTYLLYPAIDNATGLPVRLGARNSLPPGARPDPREATRPDRPWINSGVPEYSTTALAYNLEVGLDEQLSLYSFGTYSHRDAASPQNLRPANTVFINNPGLLSVYPDGFTPWERTAEDDFEVALGLRGTIAGWEWDVSNVYGQDNVDVSVTNSANYSLTYPGAQTDFYAGRHFFSQNTTNLDLRRGIDTGFLAAPLELAIGAEHVRQFFKLEEGEEASWTGQGSQAITGYLPIDATRTRRNSTAAYIGLSTDVVTGWFVDLAGRYEHHSDFGDVVTGRVSTRLQLTPSIAARGTISNGFHAPALVTQSYSTTSDSVGVVNRLSPAGSAEARAVGGRALRPEKSENISFGLSWTPSPDLHFAVDLYQIDVRNRIALSPNIGYDKSDPANPLDASGRPLTGAQVDLIDSLIRAAGLQPTAEVFRVRYFTNAGDTRSRGVDVTAELVTRTENAGRFRWSLAANYNHTRLTRAAAVAEELQALPHIELLNESAQLALTERAPRFKLIGGVGWDYEGFQVGIRGKYYGGLRRIGNGLHYQTAGKWLADINVGYAFGNGLRIDVGIDNVFDTYPDRTPDPFRTAASVAQYQYAYDNSGPVGLLGGSWYARITKEF